MEKKTLGERCKAYRRFHVLSQQSLADRCGVHVNTIINIEQGRSAHWMTEERIKKVIGDWEE